MNINECNLHIQLKPEERGLVRTHVITLFYEYKKMFYYSLRSILEKENVPPFLLNDALTYLILNGLLEEHRYLLCQSLCYYTITAKGMDYFERNEDDFSNMLNRKPEMRWNRDFVMSNEKNRKK